MLGLFRLQNRKKRWPLLWAAPPCNIRAISIMPVFSFSWIVTPYKEEQTTIRSRADYNGFHRKLRVRSHQRFVFFHQLHDLNITLLSLSVYFGIAISGVVVTFGNDVMCVKQGLERYNLVCLRSIYLDTFAQQYSKEIEIILE